MDRRPRRTSRGRASKRSSHDMSNPSSLSVRKPSAGGVFPDLRRMSKPHLSRLILIGTGLIIALVLLIWLLLFLGRDPVRFDGFWVSPTEMGGPWLAHQAADVRGVVVPLKGKGRQIEQDAFDRSLREHLGRSGNRPVVLYVSAAGVSDRNGGFLLPQEPGAIPPSTTSEARDSLFTLEKLVEVCREFPVQTEADPLGRRPDRQRPEPGGLCQWVPPRAEEGAGEDAEQAGHPLLVRPGADELGERVRWPFGLRLLRGDGPLGEGRRLRRPFERPHGQGAEPLREEPGLRLGEDEPAGRADPRAHRRPVDEFPPAPRLPREDQALRGTTGRRGRRERGGEAHPGPAGTSLDQARRIAEA